VRRLGGFLGTADLLGPVEYDRGVIMIAKAGTKSR
jgi:hypothetical protein